MQGAECAPGSRPAPPRTYEAAVRGGQIVVLVHGAAKDVLRARGLLRAEQPESLERKEITS